MSALNLAVRLSKRFKCNAICKRYCSDNVRVRFAPSPTGFLHLGGLRTALYNHLFARAQNGVSILRIEDTDLSRKVPDATENLIKDLQWCGIKYDEGPYFQSERGDIYQKYIKQLLDQGDAYYCFCSNTRLKLIRKEAVKAGEIPKYDNNCRNLSKKEVEAKLKAGISRCVRFKLKNFKEPVNDLICGSISHDVGEIEGDPVILKNDGFPTYHFANVVDDHLMNITHVLRGIEWQISTTKHVLLYRAFKWKPPYFGHLPLLLNTDGTKLSKRQGDAQVRFLRESGFLPNAIINFIIRFGGGFDIEQSEKDLRTFTFEELLERFDLSRIKSSSCKISLNDLNDYNQLEIVRLLKTEDGRVSLVRAAQEILKKHYKDRRVYNLQIGEQQVLKILELMKYRINKLEDLVSKEFSFLWDRGSGWIERDKTNVESIKKLIKEIEAVEWNADVLKMFLKEFSDKNNMNPSSLMKTLRAVLCGNHSGPAIPEVMELLGREDVQLRLSAALEDNSEV